MHVKVISHKGAAVLVEWIDSAGGLQRAYLPESELTDGPDGPEAADPHTGIEYGLPWEELVTFQAEAPAVAQALRRQGIWTLQDLQANPQGAAGAFQKVYGMDVQALRAAARAFLDSNQEGTPHV